jgi:FkbM family methyltransferase
MPQNWDQHVRGDSHNVRKLLNTRTKIFQNFCESKAHAILPAWKECKHYIWKEMNSFEAGAPQSRFWHALHSLGVRRDHIVRAPLRSIVRLLARRDLVPLDLLMGASLDVIFRMQLPEASFRYHVAPGDGLGARLFWQDWQHWEPDTVLQFARSAKNSPRILDVGAHTGIYSLYACALNPRAEVFSFEPLPHPYSRLVENCKLNAFDSRCKTFQGAVSNTAGSARFHIAEDPTMSRLVESGGELEVPVLRLDDVVPLDGKTQFVKMDVEGHEYQALLGMENIIADSHPAILFECNPGGRGPDIDTLLRRHGYQLFHLDARQVTPISELVPERFPHGSHNFLAQ